MGRIEIDMSVDGDRDEKKKDENEEKHGVTMKTSSCRMIICLRKREKASIDADVMERVMSDLDGRHVDQMKERIQ